MLFEVIHLVDYAMHLLQVDVTVYQEVVDLEEEKRER